MLWNAWFNPNSFYSYCAFVPLVSAALAYQNFRQQRSQLFPILFLVFMFPIPPQFTDPISHVLKLQCASMAATILSILQIHSVAHRNVIVMPHGNVVVNDACSGIRAIISLLAMGSVF